MALARVMGLSCAAAVLLLSCARPRPGGVRGDGAPPYVPRDVGALLEYGPPPSGTPFTVALLSDTQYYTEAFPETFIAQTQWLAENAASLRLALVTHQGDVLRRGYSRRQVANAVAGFDRLHNVVPYSVSIGNHDYDNPLDDLDHHRSAARFTAAFGPERYKDTSSAWRGWTPERRSHYQLFEGGGRRFMLLSLEWEPTDAAIAWAQRVIDQHPALPVILSTHEYVTVWGRTTTPLDQTRNAAGEPVHNSGERIFRKLVRRNEQIFLVVCGNIGGEHQQMSLNDAGSYVYEVLADYSDRPEGGEGWMQLLEFDPQARAIRGRTVSPVLGKEEDDADSRYTLLIDFDKRFAFASRGGSAEGPTRVNQAPVAEGDRAEGWEDRPMTIDVLANDRDADGDELRPVVETLPEHGAVVVNSDGTLTYVPRPRFTGVDEFAYSVTDGSDLAAATVSVTVRPAHQVYDYPEAEVSVFGAASGPAGALLSCDGRELSLKEVMVEKSSRLEHRWRFDVTGGTDVTLGVKARRSWGPDEFRFQYSTDRGVLWQDVIPLVPGSSRAVTRVLDDADQPHQLWALPPTTSGTVWVRAIDTEPADESLDTLTVDELFIRSGVGPPDAAGGS